MLTRLMLLAFLTLVFGCTGSHGPPPVEGISQDQLIPTLDRIAETGEFEKENLFELMAGLENLGLMNDAASAQQLAVLTDEKQVKLLAKRLSAAVQRELASGDH